MSAGRVALVTGASRGIGRGIVKALSLDGVRTYGCSRTPPDGDASRDTWLACDVTREEDVARVVKEVVARERRLDILVNNAGVSFLTNGSRTRFDAISSAQWEYVLRANLYSAFWFSKYAAPSMIERRSGVIINIASASIKTGGVLASVDYIASKAGLVGLTKGLAFELGKHNVRVNAIAPGRIQTDMTAEAIFGDGWAARNVLLGRLGTPDDVASLVSFLASNRAQYMTGATIDCNGGWVVE